MSYTIAFAGAFFCGVLAGMVALTPAKTLREFLGGK